MPIQQKNNNWLMTDLLQSIGGLGRQKFPYFQAPDNKVECPGNFCFHRVLENLY